MPDAVLGAKENDVTSLKRLLTLSSFLAVLVTVCWATQELCNLLAIPLDLRATSGSGQIVLYVLLLAGVWAFVRFAWAGQGMTAFTRNYCGRANRPRVLLGLLTGTAAGLAVGVIGFGTMIHIGGAKFNLHALQQMNFATLKACFFTASIIPIMVATEELLFRAFVYNYLRGDRQRRHGVLSTLVAILGSAFIFAFAHGFRDPAGWLEDENQPLFMGLFLLGIWLALAYEVSGSLTVGMGIHTALLWSKVPRRCSVLVTDQDHHWWAGIQDDPRTAPFVWMLFIVMIFATLACHRRLFAMTAVETADLAEREAELPARNDETDITPEPCRIAA